MTDAPKLRKIRVLVCDDSVFSRVALRKIIESDTALKLIDVARNGKEAVEKAQALNPDVILLDFNMPVMDGAAALKEIVKLKIAPVIMVSSYTGKSAVYMVDAVEAGAFDFIAKPDGASDFATHAAEVIKKIKSAALSSLNGVSGLDAPGAETPTESRPFLRRPTGPEAGGDLGFKLVALGISTGGPRSIMEVLPLLPGELNAAVIVVQHMPTAFITAFSERLNKKTAMECLESEDGMPVEPGKIYIARGGVHLKIRRRKNGSITIRQSDEPQHLFMPSIDVMMDSVSDIFGADTIGVLMTGMGRDGAQGMVKITKMGGVTIAESEETAVVFGMPQEAVKIGGAKIVAPHRSIAAEIIKAVNGIK